jgi:colicin import membrane protein
MKKLLLAAALSAAVIAPTAASAQVPDPATSKNAAKYCKELRSFSGGANFVSMFGTKKNAYGKCVSQTAKKDAAEDAAQEKAAKEAAREECRALKTPGSKNAFGKCVSEKAKAKKAAADAEDEAQEDDRINAAKSCKAAKKADADAFATEWGTKKNAYGKCVSKTAKELAAERKAEEPAPTA